MILAASWNAVRLSESKCANTKCFNLEKIHVAGCSESRNSKIPARKRSTRQCVTFAADAVTEDEFGSEE